MLNTGWILQDQITELDELFHPFALCDFAGTALNDQLTLLLSYTE